LVQLKLITPIAAPAERCFDLSRNIDLHLASTNWTGEQAITGVTSGLIGNNQEVTWRARVLGIPVKHTSRITAYEFPRYFQDSMVKGAFHSYCHDHYFETQDGGTLMRDEIGFAAPCGLLGRAVERLWLEQYLRKLLERRNAYIKQVAEGEDWKQYVS
jgi:ligand-binding SRPBCC domain-containing protein